MLIKRIIKNPLIENFISLALLQGLNYLLPLVTVPFLFNRLGVEFYGLLNFALAFTQYFFIITDFGFGLSATRFIAENRENKEKIKEYFNSVMFSRCLLAGVSFFILLVCMYFIPVLKENKLFFFLFFGQVIGNVMSPYWFFQGMEKMRFITILSTASRCVGILPLFFIIKDSGDYLYIPICYSVGSIIGGGACLWVIRNKFNISFFYTGIKNVIQVTKDSGTYFLSRISLSVFTNTNILILGLVLGNTAVGYYSLADKVYQVFNSIYNPLVNAIFPYMTKTKNLKMFKKIFIGTTIINSVCTFVTFFLASFLLNLFFDDIDVSCVRILQIFMVACFISLPSTLLGYPFLAAWGHPNFTNLTLIVVSVFHIIGVTLLWILGLVTVYSIAWMVVFTELLLFIYRIYGTYKYKLLNNG